MLCANNTSVVRATLERVMNYEIELPHCGAWGWWRRQNAALPAFAVIARSPLPIVESGWPSRSWVQPPNGAAAIQRLFSLLSAWWPANASLRPAPLVPLRGLSIPIGVLIVVFVGFCTLESVLSNKRMVYMELSLDFSTYKSLQAAVPTPPNQLIYLSIDSESAR